jgi:hypothetical protein
MTPTPYTGFKELAEGIGALVTALALVGAGLVLLFKREWRPRLELAPTIEAFRRIGDSFLLEPVCFVHNKGLLRCYIYQLSMSVRYLRLADPLVSGNDKLLFATTFPHTALKVDLVKPEWGWSYVEAGVRVRYSNVVHIPADSVAVLVWVKVFHKEGEVEDFVAAQKVGVIKGDQLLLDHEKNAINLREGGGVAERGATDAARS